MGVSFEPRGERGALAPPERSPKKLDHIFLYV
jgi:hypothetical protein